MRVQNPKGNRENFVFLELDVLAQDVRDQIEHADVAAEIVVERWRRRLVNTAWCSATQYLGQLGPRASALAQNLIDATASVLPLGVIAAAHHGDELGELSGCIRVHGR